MFTGAVFFKTIAEGDLFAYSLNDQCMALSMHLFTITTQVTERAARRCPTPPRSCCWAGAAGQRHLHRAARLPALRKKW